MSKAPMQQGSIYNENAAACTSQTAAFLFIVFILVKIVYAYFR